MKSKGIKEGPEVKSFKVTCVILILETLLFACPVSVSCPADHSEMHRVGDEYSGLGHFAIYQHTTSAGVTHQVPIRCDQ
ncbi:MAG: hypothetical protein WBQ68_18285 [Terriglobales bacterium]